jgi:hypothetical protein
MLEEVEVFGPRVHHSLGDAERIESLVSLVPCNTHCGRVPDSMGSEVIRKL